MPINKIDTKYVDKATQVVFGTGDITIAPATAGKHIPCLLLIEGASKPESEWDNDTPDIHGVSTEDMQRDFVELRFTKKRSLEILISQLQKLLEDFKEE